MLSNIEFGTVDAESEPRLKEFFVDNGTLKRIRDHNKYLILGRKGSGKTALFIEAGDHYGETAISILFKDYHWEYHKLIKEQGLPLESAYSKSWAFTILIHIVKHWADNSNDDNLKSNSIKFLIEIFGDEYKNLGNKLIDFLTSIKKIGVGAGPYISGSLELDANKGSLIAIGISGLIGKLEEFVVSNIKNNPVIVLLDQLDDGWDNSDESKNLIIGALKSVRDINNRIQKILGYPNTLLFLRDDIYSELRFNDKNKMLQGAEFLEWNEQNLIQIIAKRVAVAFDINPIGTNVDSILKHAFTQEDMRSRANYKTYIILRTMMRPRDIVAFIILCKETALELGEEKIGKKSIYKAEEKFSRHIYDELIDETHKQFPDLEKCLQMLITIGKTKIKYIDLEDSVKRLQSPLAVEDVATLLYQFGVIGIPQSGGQQRAGGNRYYYNDRAYRPDFKKSILVVHPSLKKYLKLTEPRNRK